MASTPRFHMNSVRNLLTAPTAANGNFPPLLKLTPKADAYKGYVTPYIEISVRTNIDSDTDNKGVIAAEIPSEDLLSLFEAVRGAIADKTTGDCTFELKCFKTIYSKGASPSAPIHISTFKIRRKDGLWAVGLFSTKSERPKIVFEMGAGVPNKRRYSSFEGTPVNAAMFSEGAMLNWINKVTKHFSDDLEVAMAIALEKDREKNGDSGRDSAPASARHTAQSTYSEDDLPF